MPVEPTLLAALGQARTLLFVRGTRPERFDKALCSGADAVVFDLEDVMPPASKAAARDAIRAAWRGLHSAGVPWVLRINALDQLAGEEDMARLAPYARHAAPHPRQSTWSGATIDACTLAATLRLGAALPRSTAVSSRASNCR
ncbi:MAG: aldolase/citrate lyase family protein [Burkholderiales bacterium]